LDEAVIKYYPGRSENETQKFKDFVKSLQNFESEFLNDFKISELEKFNHINLTDLVFFV
jgi:hypothetical protein